jgi:hypothetical protein
MCSVSLALRANPFRPESEHLPLLPTITLHHFSVRYTHKCPENRWLMTTVTHLPMNISSAQLNPTEYTVNREVVQKLHKPDVAPCGFRFPINYVFKLCVTRVLGHAQGRHVIYAYIVLLCIARVARSCDIIYLYSQPPCSTPMARHNERQRYCRRLTTQDPLDS